MNRLFKILSTIVNNEEKLLFVINNKKLEFVNQSFLNFFNVKSLEKFKTKYIYPCKMMKVDKI